MLSAERQKIIMDLVDANGSIDVTVLAEQFQTSKETIRRDLRMFEKQGLLKRTHGGAVAVGGRASSPVAAGDPLLAETPIGLRRNRNIQEKKRICSAAVSFIADKDVIYVDNSTTTIFLAQYIPKNITVTIITNSIAFIIETLKLSNPNILLFCAPGFCNANNLSLYGNYTVKIVEDFFPSKAFVSCAGIFANGQIADTSMYETETKRAFIRKSDQVFLLADQSKFNRTAPYFLTDFDSLDYLITDCKRPDFNWQMLESKGCALVVAE